MVINDDNLFPNPDHKKILDGGVELWNEWRKHNPGIKPELQGISLHGMVMHRVDFNNTDLQCSDLSEADLSEANLSNAILARANLKNITFSKANLKDAVLEYANLEKAFGDNAHCEKANLYRANLQGANLCRMNFKKANLIQANLKNAILWDANIQGADLKGANFVGTNVIGVRYNRWAKYRGIRLDGCYGSPRFKRFAGDQEFIEELRAAWWRKPVYWLWLVFADCGRSLLLWSAWSILFAGLFGAIYSGFVYEILNYLPWIPESLKHLLATCNPALDMPPSASWYTPYYFSIVTFTTLGFGDVTPKNLAGEIWVTAEVILGYLMLGGLISIFSTKLARRA